MLIGGQTTNWTKFSATELQTYGRSVLKRDAMVSDKAFSDLSMPHPTCATLLIRSFMRHEERICILSTLSFFTGD